MSEYHRKNNTKNNPNKRNKFKKPNKRQRSFEQTQKSNGAKIYTNPEFVKKFNNPSKH